MFVTDWLKPLKSIGRRIQPKRIRRCASRQAVSFSGVALSIATCERLENRQLLSAVTESIADLEPGHDHEQAAGQFYLPPQHRLGDGNGFLSGPAPGDAFQVATNFLFDHTAELGLSTADLSSFVVSSRYTDDGTGITHLYLRQTLDGLEVMNADIGINVGPHGEILTVGSSFIPDASVVTGTDQIVVTAPQAFAALSGDLGLGLESVPQIIRVDENSPDYETFLTAAGVSSDDVRATLVYVPTPQGLERAWRINVLTTNLEHWYDGFVSATDGASLYASDWAGHVTYNAYAFPVKSPTEGSRTLVAESSDPTASPYGWHDIDGVAGADFTDTRGNNVFAQEDRNDDNAGGFRPDGGANLNFDFPLDLTQDPVSNQSASITNLFYWMNLMHDIYYQYGFTEAAGNFQVNNYGRGGIGNDPLLADAQDGADLANGAGLDRTRFMTPPDGESPRVQVSVYNFSNPYRDSDFDTTVLAHEYTHGLTRRLTGGAADTDTLNALQSAGMDEGWADWYSLMVHQVATDSIDDGFAIGTYSLGQDPSGPGFRRQLYSFDMSVDPITLDAFNGGPANNELHKVGEIWASALWDLNWLLVQKYGFNEDILHGDGGNNLAMQLVTEGLKLQPANPSFLAGRDAILAADLAFNGGANQAEIWTAFARRGMGFSADDGGNANAVTVAEAFDLPPLGAVSGNVFRDDDGNGLRNGTEPGLAGWSLYSDVNNNGVRDESTTTSTFSATGLPVPIVDHGQTYSTISVSGLEGTITDVNVTVTLTHPVDKQLNIAIYSPLNTITILAQFVGGEGDNFTNTVFDDEAATTVASGTAPFTGSFKPLYDLGRFDGGSPNGDWKLRLDDIASGDVGTLLSWSIQISYYGAEPVTISDANGNYSFQNLVDGTYHIRELDQPGFTRTVPASGVVDAVVSGGQPVVGQNFGNRSIATVASGSTNEDTLSSALVITPPADLGATHFKISGIAGGTLYLNNGLSVVSNDSFITVAEGLAGLKFLPSANSTADGHFDVELSLDGLTVATGTSKASSTIIITPIGDTPQVVSISTPENTLSQPILIDRNAADGEEVTHFRITGITGGTLFKNDGITPIANGDYITITDGQAGVKFLPSFASLAAGHFDVESSQDGSTVAAQSGKATSTVIIQDITAPGVMSFQRLTPTTSLTNADSLVFRVTFTEAVIDVDVADFAVSGVSTAEVTSVAGVDSDAGLRWDVTVSGGNLANFNGAIGLNLSAAQNITDTSGNALPNGEPSIDETFVVDSTIPLIAVILTPSILNTGTLQSDVTFNFSEEVVGFTLDDVAVAGGMVSNFRIIDGLHYAATFTADADFEGTGSVSTGTAYTDLAGNMGTAGSDSISIDTRNPTLTVNVVDASLSNVDNSSDVLFTFSEAVIGFDVSDVTVTGGTLSSFSGSGAAYSATFIAFDEFSGTASVAVLDGSYTDASGNSGIGDIDTVSIFTISEITVTLNDAQNLVVAVSEQGFVEVVIDGEVDASIPLAYAAELSTLTIRGGAGSNHIDLSAISPVKFSNPEGVSIRVDAGDGNDVILGSSFDDTLNGEDGDDEIHGGAGDDVINGGLGDNDLNGDSGTDTLVVVTAYHLSLFATTASGAGNDTFASFEKGILQGDTHNNRIDASSAPFPVTISGFNGSDTLLGSLYSDTLDGGDGYDVVEIHGSNIVLTDSVAPGADGDTVAAVEGLQLIASARGSLIDASAYTLGPVVIVGSSGNDTLKGGSGNDTIIAGSGADIVTGGAGNDFILGGAGNDDLSGNDGDDLIVGGNGRDTIDGGQGADILRGGGGADTIRGGDGNDILYGGAGRDLLDGDGGADTLIGGAGQDSLAGCLGADILNGIAVDDSFNATVKRDSLIGGTRPQGRPAPINRSGPSTSKVVDKPISLMPSAIVESRSIDDAFSDSLLPEYWHSV
ncbi:MAG: proprotein convertase P-domain-containing protein [Rhodopirellula sp.]|nr:proprotein convertase P-domain-containing protein [Rhodopirellula sp.]